jgi:hypothetical protein
MHTHMHVVRAYCTIKHNHCTKVYVFAKRRRYIWRNCFFQVAVELHPLILWEGSQVNIWVGLVKNQSCFMLKSKVYHDVKGGLKVSLTWVSKIG